MVNFSDVLKAKERITGIIPITPLDFSIGLSTKTTKVSLKLECQNKQKTFKVRGALNKIASLSEIEKKSGIIAVSSGNHGAGVSYAANLLGIEKAKVYVPSYTPQAKLSKIRYYGAEINQDGETYDDAHRLAIEAAEKESLTYIDPCSDVEVIAGQGTIGLEILHQNPDVDTIIVPIGGGGLITGISVATKKLKPEITIIGVQTEACPAMVQALKDKKCYLEYPSEDSLCDALIGGVSEIGYNMANQCIDDILVVKEETIKKATALLLAEEKVVAEPSSATGIAALLENPNLFEGKNIAVVITGGNLDKNLMESLLAY